MQIALIITTYNNHLFLAKVLDTIRQQTQLPDEIIIADDGSTATTKNTIDEKQNYFNIKLQHCWQEDNGFRAAKIRNKAIAMAKADYIIIIDGDMLLDCNFIKDHCRMSASNSIMLGSRALISQATTAKILQNQLNSLNFFTKGISNRHNTINNLLLARLFTWRKYNINRVLSCNLACWRQDFIKINGFNEEFIFWGREDNEFIARMIHAKVKIYKLKFAATAYHMFHLPNSKTNLKQNDKLLANTIKLKLTYCKYGIDQYLL